MKVLNKVLIGVASLAMLTACASKTDYASFHEKAVAAFKEAKEVSFSEVVLKGTSKDEDGEHKYDGLTIKFEKGSFKATNISHLDEVAAALMLSFLTADLIPEESDVTYYAGSTFKVVSQDEDSKGTMTWNKYALPTAVKTSDKDGNQSNYTVSYKK